MVRPTYDVFGHCVKCHKNMLIWQIIDNVPVNRFKPDYSETTFLLDNGTKMRVAICKSCKENLNEGDNKEIMRSVVDGWKHEVETYVKQGKWDEDKKNNYLRDYQDLAIVTNADNKDKNRLDFEFNEYKERKIKVKK